MLPLKQKMLFAAFFICLCLQSIAQPIDKSIIEKYHPSVVAKLFSIAKYVEVDKQQQLQMAESIRLHDSTICSWMINGKTKASIDTLQQVAQFQLYGMLSKQQLKAYKYNSNIQISNAIADGEAEYLAKEYKPDSLTLQDLRKSLSNKYNYILQHFSDNYLMNKAVANEQLQRLEGVYDHYKYYPVFYSRKFIGEFTTRISKIKSIPDNVLTAIEHDFYNLVWQNKHTDWSFAALHVTRKHFPDTAIIASLLKQEITQKAFEGTANEGYNLVYREHVSETAYKKIEKLVKEKSYKNCLLQYTYAVQYPQQFATLLKANNAYYDSVIKSSLIYDGSLLPTTQFAIALKYKNDLKLTSGLCDTLVHHAMVLEKQRDSIVFRDPFAIIDFTEYETLHLSRLLTEDQYNTLLFHKNRTYAEANAATDWKEMVVRGLDKGFIRDEAITQITEYYIMKNAAWCRYANDKIKLWANLYSLDQIKPKALKVLDPIRWSGSTEQSTNNLQLQW